MYHIIEELLAFGLTRQESRILMALWEQGAMTGYEVAKLTGISRSNTYTALAGLVEKGAAYTMEENVSKYLGVDFVEFSNNVLRHLTQIQKEIISHLPSIKEETQGYITLHGETQIMDKLITMIEETQYRLYLSVPGDVLQQVEPYLLKQLTDGKRVVILTDCAYALEGAVTYHTTMGDSQIRLIVDSHKVLTGRISSTEVSTCLYSLNQNLVDVFKEMLQNEITLIKLKNSPDGMDSETMHP